MSKRKYKNGQSGSRGIDYINNALNRLSLKATEKTGTLLPLLHNVCKKSGKLIQKRADARLNIISILIVLITEIELSTFCWGRFMTTHKGETDLWTRGIKYLHEKTGINIKTVSRTLKSLEDAGYLEVTRRSAIGKDDNEIRIFSLRRLTKKFFLDLDFRPETIEEIQHWKREELNKQQYGKKLTNVCKDGLQKIGAIFKANTRKPKAKYKNNAKRKGPFGKSARRVQDMMTTAYDQAIETGANVIEIYKSLQKRQLIQ